MTSGSVVEIEEQVDVVGPSVEMVGPIRSGDTLVAYTAPGCWGPMITPDLRAAHEVTRPVAVEGAEPGDCLLICIESIRILSRAATSGVERRLPDRFDEDPVMGARCPACGSLRPLTRAEGIGEDAVRCIACGSPASPFGMRYGFTMVFDDQRKVGLTVGSPVARRIAREARQWSALPAGSRQHPAVLLASSDLVGLACRLEPFIGNLGTVPGVDVPSNRNAGDAATVLVGADHELSLGVDQLGLLTDSHMDNNRVVEGSTLLAPVRVEGGGLYLGDVHAMQGDGELAGHTVDVSARVQAGVHLVKGLTLPGPVLFPPAYLVPRLLRPLAPEESTRAASLARRYGVKLQTKGVPVHFIGSGENLNAAADCAVMRAALVTGMSPEEVKVRATIAGAVEICRLPGVVRVSLPVPLASPPVALLPDTFRSALT